MAKFGDASREASSRTQGPVSSLSNVNPMSRITGEQIKREKSAAMAARSSLAFCCRLGSAKYQILAKGCYKYTVGLLSGSLWGGVFSLDMVTFSKFAVSNKQINQLSSAPIRPINFLTLLYLHSKPTHNIYANAIEFNS